MLVRRENKNGSKDLHVIYRPCTVDEFFGSEINKRIIKNYLDTDTLPHTLLFTGDSGCGKTTIARTIALGLNCKEGVTSTPCLKCSSCSSILNQNSIDIREINIGKSGTKGEVDDYVKSLAQAPFNSRFIVLIFDEAHALSSAAQNLLLKIIEDGYSHVYFIFCTNHPEKLKEEFLSRCYTIHFNRLNDDLLLELLKNVCEFEGTPYNEPILNFIVENSKGVPRSALVLLGKVSAEGSWTLDAAKELLGVLVDEDNIQVIELSRALIQGQWKKSLSLYSKLSKVPAESIRIALMGYFVGCLKRATTLTDGVLYSEVLDAISVPIYETGKPAEYKLINYMFKIVKLIKK